MIQRIWITNLSEGLPHKQESFEVQSRLSRGTNEVQRLIQYRFLRLESCELKKNQEPFAVGDRKAPTSDLCKSPMLLIRSDFCRAPIGSREFGRNLAIHSMLVKHLILFLIRYFLLHFTLLFYISFSFQFVIATGSPVETIEHHLKQQLEFKLNLLIINICEQLCRTQRDSGLKR